MKTVIHHWVFGMAAWAGFIVSFFLPAYDQMPGWKASILQEFFWRQANLGNLIAVHYLLLTLANLVMIVSPFFMTWGTDDGRFVKWLRGLSLAAAALVWLFVAKLLAVHAGLDLRPGCYLWAGSFVVLSVAAWLQPATVKVKVEQMM